MKAFQCIVNIKINIGGLISKMKVFPCIVNIKIKGNELFPEKKLK